jgi:DME family drug/metabolite transporter
MRSHFFSGALCVACAAVLWGTAGTAQTFLDAGELSPLWVAALRLFFAACLFLPLLTYREGCRALSIPKDGSLRLILACGVAMAAYNLLFFAAMRAAGVAVGTAIVIGSAPVWATAIECMLGGARPAPGRLFGLSIAIAGGVLMATAGREDFSVSLSALGVCLSAGLAYASFTVMTKELVGSLSPIRATALSFTLAMFLAFAVAFAASPLPVLTLKGIGVTLYLGLLTTGAAYLLFSSGLRHLKASTGVALSLLEPVTAFLLAVTVAGEAVTFSAVVALILLLGGLFWVLRNEDS